MAGTPDQASRQVTLRLFKVDNHPKRIAICGVDTFVVGGAFFLDFSRPLRLRRWLGVGPVTGASVPVVHEGQSRGDYVVEIDRGNPYFADIRELWRLRYPLAPRPPATRADATKIAADFASQFPNHE